MDSQCTVHPKLALGLASLSTWHLEGGDFVALWAWGAYMGSLPCPQANRKHGGLCPQQSWAVIQSEEASPQASARCSAQWLIS